MTRTAILVDGNLYLRRARRLRGNKPPVECAEELHAYAVNHITQRRDVKLEFGNRSLYRIFYYDCPPVSDARVKQPWNEHNRVFSKRNPSNVWSTEFQAALAGMRKVAMRMGEVRTANMHFNLKEESLKKSLAKKIAVDDLDEKDFTLVGMKQSGVDMRIGLDVASLANEKIVDQIILIAGDTDFVPVAKTARRAGVDFLIDPMGHNLPAEFIRQVDGVEDLSGTLLKGDTSLGTV